MTFVFLIPIIALICGAAIVKWSLEYSKWKHELKAGARSADHSLGTSELKHLIREAVEEANQSLVERLDALEAHRESAQGPRLGDGPPENRLLDRPVSTTS